MVEEGDGPLRSWNCSGMRSRAPPGRRASGGTRAPCPSPSRCRRWACRASSGVPLETSDGQQVGSLCAAAADGGLFDEEHFELVTGHRLGARARRAEVVRPRAEVQRLADLVRDPARHPSVRPGFPTASSCSTGCAASGRSAVAALTSPTCSLCRLEGDPRRLGRSSARPSPSSGQGCRRDPPRDGARLRPLRSRGRRDARRRAGRLRDRRERGGRSSTDSEGCSPEGRHPAREPQAGLRHPHARRSRLARGSAASPRRWRRA